MPNSDPKLTSPLFHPDRPPVRGTILAGVAAIAIGFGGFAAWASLAPLASAAVAQGSVQVDTKRKTVQHRDGGIIAELLVREGAHVEAGQVLVRLDDIESRAAFDILEAQYYALTAQEARLLAERDGLTDLHFPAELEQQRHRPEIAEILNGQQRVFDTRLRTLSGQLDILQQRIAQQQAQISALEAQLAAGETQRFLIRDELSGVKELVAKGLERKPRLLALERAAAQLEGAQGDYRGRIAQAREAIAEAELQKIDLRNTRFSEAAAELRDVQTRRAEIDEKRRTAAVQLERHDVVAPQAGTVLNLRYHTPGGVIAPGGEILDLVPEDDRLMIDARVNPMDIDVVRTGLPAQIVLSAFKQRSTPHLDGRVVRVSADALIEEHTGAPYFLARIEVDSKQLARLDGISLYPGMPTEVLIVTGERSLLDYLLQPIKDSFNRAFREA